MWFNKTWKTVETNSEEWNVSEVLKKLTAYYFNRMHPWEFGAFMCWCESHTLCLFSGLSTQRKEHTKEKWQICGYWSIHSFGSLFSRDSYSERLERSWALSLEQLSASYWQLVRGDFPSGRRSVWKEAFILHMPQFKWERRYCLTITFSIVTVK